MQYTYTTLPVSWQIGSYISRHSMKIYCLIPLKSDNNYCISLFGTKLKLTVFVTTHSIIRTPPGQNVRQSIRNNITLTRRKLFFVTSLKKIPPFSWELPTG